MIFHVTSVHHLKSKALDEPVDMAPVVIESSDPNWSSNTPLDINSDIYVALRRGSALCPITGFPLKQRKEVADACQQSPRNSYS
jgi:hypothetical protein